MRALIPLLLLFLAGCSSTPVAIKNPPSPDWQLSQIAGKAASHQGETVRWGGQIIKVDNDDSGSTLHIAQFPLNSYGRPISDKNSEGRFLAHTRDFIDPYIYKSGTLITIAGRVTGEKQLTVDQKTLSVPVIGISEMYRWSAQHYRDPYWYRDPYYDYFGYGLSYPAWRSNWYYRHGYYW